MFYYVHNNNKKKLLSMQNVLEQGPYFWCWFDKTKKCCHCVNAIHACKDVFNPFQSNRAEGLHFSAFHYSIDYNYYSFAITAVACCPIY